MNETYHHYSIFHVAYWASSLWEQEGGASHFILCESGDPCHAILCYTPFYHKLSSVSTFQTVLQTSQRYD